MAEQSYPIAECFESPQGEGLFAGSLMCFLRLAGCNVGKPYTAEEKKLLPNSSPYQEKCSSWEGNVCFECDTDFRTKYRATIEFILKEPLIANAKRVCLTGGEPLIHDLKPLATALALAGKKVHIETSGTKPLTVLRLTPQERLRRSNNELETFAERALERSLWITVSPKKDYLPESLELADEIKVLVGENFNETLFLQHFERYINSDKFWIQPINDEFTVRMENVKRCLELQQKYKSLRISTQAHKFWNVR
jgi:organic radical activating enzyme